MRYAAYLRISSEEQVGNFSIDAQRRAVEAWVAAREGRLVQIYIDEAQSGRSAQRPGFQKMRRDARKGKFDALVVHKFDRFARNRTDALAIKSLLRCDYGVKVFSATEPSEDSDGPIGALIEGIMESVADWYSQNLANETTKGKHERSLQGLHNNQPPFGLRKGEDNILVPDIHEVVGLRLAFEEYATGRYSDSDIAHLLNSKGYQARTGRPFSKETVRFMLQNQTYCGKIRYQQTTYSANGVRSRTAPVQWLAGQHAPVIEPNLFETCQVERAKRCRHRQSTAKYHPYLLRNLVYCYGCCSHPPQDKTFRTYGKMRPQLRSTVVPYYRCRAREMGYSCRQKLVQAELIDQQVVWVLKHLKPPRDWRATIVRSVGELLGEQKLEERLAELQAVIRRMDMRWDNGLFVDEQEYLDQRLKLQQEVERLTPVARDDLEQTADLLHGFTQYWESCDGSIERQHDLVQLIVERVYVQGEQVVAMTLNANAHLVLGHKANGPTESSVDPFLSTRRPEKATCGDDGI